MTPLEEEDLKRPDRVPDRVPKVGDLVKIKSRAWYAKWVGPKLREVSGFAYPMAEFCGRIMSVASVRKNGYLSKFDTFRLNEDNMGWTWCITDFEDVYPADSVMAVIESNLDRYRSLVKKTVENCCDLTISTGESPSDGITVSYNAYKTGNIVAKEPAAPIYVEDKTNTSGHPKDTPLKLVDINPIKLKKV